MNKTFIQFLQIKRVFFLIFALILSGSIVAQSPEKTKIEQELLVKARQNIEKYRKGNASVVFTDSKGIPIKDIKVEINQTTQDFLFGNLSEEIFRLSADDAAKFQEKFTGLFNYTELTVKWWNYEGQQLSLIHI